MRWPLAIATPIVVLPGVLALVFRDGEVIGFLVGATFASYVWFVALAVQRLAGTGARLMGPIAEGWTVEELRSVERDGWVIRNSVLLQGEDVDHVVMGPTGVFAVETKWSSYRWTSRHFSLQSAAEQARRNATAIGRRLIGGQHRGAVRPVLAVWGEHDAELTSVDAVPVVHGLELAGWLRAQTSDNALEIAAAADRLDTYITRRVAHEAASQRLTRYEEVGVLGLVSDFTFTAAACLATVLVGAYAVVFLGAPGLASPLPIAGLAYLARRRKPFRAAGNGVIAGCVFLAALSAVSIAIYIVQ